MELTDERKGVVLQENNGENILENCTTDDSVEDNKYDKIVFVTKEKVMMLETMAINTASPFKDLFPIREKDLKNIEESMKNNGFNSGLPITLWAGHNTTVVDGHTRLAAAKKLMFARIPVILKEFKDEAEALKYAIEMQTNRRNLSDAELLNCIKELDKRQAVGRPKKIVSSDTISEEEQKTGVSSKNTADLLGISQTKVAKCRAILDHASEEIKNAIKAGEVSLNKAYNQTMDARRLEMYKSDSQRRTDMHFEAQKGIPKVAKKFMNKLVEKNPDILFSGAEARILYRDICKELMNIINMATVPAEKLHQD